MSSDTLCAGCVSGFVLPGTPRGTEEQIGPYKAYVSEPSGGVKKSDVALVFFYDAFGLGLQNNKVLADMFADKLGIRVYEPDVCAYLDAQGVKEPTLTRPSHVHSRGRRGRRIGYCLHALHRQGCSCADFHAEAERWCEDGRSGAL